MSVSELGELTFFEDHFGSNAYTSPREEDLHLSSLGIDRENNVTWTIKGKELDSTTKKTACYVASVLLFIIGLFTLPVVFSLVSCALLAFTTTINEKAQDIVFKVSIDSVRAPRGDAPLVENEAFVLESLFKEATGESFTLAHGERGTHQFSWLPVQTRANQPQIDIATQCRLSAAIKRVFGFLYEKFSRSILLEGNTVPEEIADQYPDTHTFSLEKTQPKEFDPSKEITPEKAKQLAVRLFDKVHAQHGYLYDLESKLCDLISQSTLSAEEQERQREKLLAATKKLFLYAPLHRS